MAGIGRFREFVCGMTRLVDQAGDALGNAGSADETLLLDRGEALLADLIAADDWLPEPFTIAGADTYRQYLLHCDPRERFSVVSFVWGPGQKTPVHDHTVWGLVGQLRGAERSTPFSRDAATGRLVAGPSAILSAGQIERVSPSIGDIHVVENACPDRVSISIHVYGANIGAVRRHVFDPASGVEKLFISGYSAAICPNLWDRSRDAA